MVYKGIWILFVVIFILGCNSDQAKINWQKTDEDQFEYAVIMNAAQQKIDVGDQILFHYALYNGDQLIESTFDRAEAVELILPDKMHRNQFMDPLTLVGEGDSLLMRIPYNLAKGELSSFTDQFQEEDVAVFHYKIIKVVSRASQVAKKQTIYAQEKGFGSVKAMLKEQKQMQQAAATRAQELQSKIEAFKQKQLELKDGPKGLQYLPFQAGTGSVVGSKDSVYFYYQLALLENGKIIDTNLERGDRYLLQIGEPSPLIPAFSLALQCLKNQGRAIFFITPELGYGEKGSLPVVPSNAKLVLDLEIVALKADSSKAIH